MKIIPVMDILKGEVVHAVKGKRNKYQPLQQSVLCSSNSPFAIAGVFDKCGFAELYVADLDAIMNKKPNLEIINQIADEYDINLMVDAGVTSLEIAEQIFDCNVSKIIVGTETLIDLQFMRKAVEFFGKDRVVASLDMIRGQVISQVNKIRLMNPVSLAHEFQDMGMSQIIVLDLARVGSGEGPRLELLQEIEVQLEIDVISGGGVRDVSDLLELRKIGVSGVLLATALHSGMISVEKLRLLGLL